MTMTSSVAPSGPGGAGPAEPRATPAMRQAAEEFEGVFLAQVLRGLTAGLTGPGLLGNGEDDPFAAMLQDEYGKLISRSGGVGVADAVLRELLKGQEAA